MSLLKEVTKYIKRNIFNEREIGYANAFSMRKGKHRFTGLLMRADEK